MTWLGIASVVFIAFSCAVGYYRGFVKEAVSLMFVMLSIIIVWVINPYVTDYLKEKTPVYITIQSKCEDSVSKYLLEEAGMGASAQNAAIAGLELPTLLKEGMTANNNSGVYQYLAVETFAEYVSDYLAVVITNGIGFFLSYILATTGIRLVAHGLNLMARLPVLRGLNRFAGFALGFLKGILVIWIVLLAATVFCNTDVGKQCIAMIEKDPVLQPLYDCDVLVQVFLNIFYGK